MLKNKKDKKNNIEQKNYQREIDLAIGNTMERFADANAQHFEAHSELKKINKYKVNKNPKEGLRNLKQQSGYSAEVKQEAGENAENILKGSKKRITRTDNNDPQFDFVGDQGGIQQKNLYRDKNGKLINYNKLATTEYEHYKDAKKIIVPSDQYDEIKDNYEKTLESLEKQERHLRKDGKTGEADEIKKE